MDTVDREFEKQNVGVSKEDKHEQKPYTAHMKKPLITLTSDFGVQSQGVGAMEAVILDIAQDAHVVHLMHGLPAFDLHGGARTMETVQFLPEKGIHVCIVDPGVGTERRPIIIQTERGDYFVGPDNGVLVSATNILGGFKKVVEITNKKYMRKDVSFIFHGRDIFSPAAAHLANGVNIKEFGKELSPEELVSAPYPEASAHNDAIDAEIIHINKFGSAHFNILHSAWDAWEVESRDRLVLEFDRKKVPVTVGDTFGDVPSGDPVIIKDDYGRVEVAINQGSFEAEHDVSVGDNCLMKRV